MKRLILLFSLVTFSTVVFGQFTQPQMVTEWTRAKAYTKAYLDAMPADGYGFKPTPEIRSFAQQMLHLTDGNYFFISTASGKPSPLKGSAEKIIEPTKEATTKAVMEGYDFVISALEGMTTAQLQEKVKLEGFEV